MRRLLIATMALGLLLAAFTLPAAAQEPPYGEQVLPILVERPPVARVPAPAAPPQVGPPAQRPAQVTAPAQVTRGGLAATGLELNVGLALALTLMLAGAGALLLAARREHARHA